MAATGKLQSHDGTVRSLWRGTRRDHPSGSRAILHRLSLAVLCGTLAASHPTGAIADAGVNEPWVDSLQSAAAKSPVSREASPIDGLAVILWDEYRPRPTPRPKPPAPAPTPAPEK